MSEEYGFRNRLEQSRDSIIEPLEKMYQVIGMNVLKDQKYEDGYFIAEGDEDRICEMFYKQLRYHFSQDRDSIIEECAEAVKHDCDCGCPCDCYGPSTARLQIRALKGKDNL